MESSNEVNIEAEKRIQGFWNDFATVYDANF
jgi:hypothetical protein